MTIKELKDELKNLPENLPVCILFCQHTDDGPMEYAKEIEKADLKEGDYEPEILDASEEILKEGLYLLLE